MSTHSGITRLPEISGIAESINLDAPSKTALQKEGIEYDRRQIRRKLQERLQERGEYLEESDDVDVGDEESVYEDTEFFPWKQREAAVEAAALGGRTEGRMEGFDSLERALQAHTHKLHYGRGRDFGWSNQQNKVGLLGERPKTLQSTRNQLTDWTSFRNITTSQTDVTENKPAPVEMGNTELETERKNHVKDLKAMKAQQRSSNMINTIYLLSAIGVCIGFAYFIETLKLDTYQSYLPEEYKQQASNMITTSSANLASNAGAMDPSTRSLKIFDSNHRVNAAPHTEYEAKFMTFQEILADYLSDRNTLQMEGTPQHDAIYWLSHRDSMNIGVPTNRAELEHLVQRFALATLYFATGGNQWISSDHFMTGLHECEWNTMNFKDYTHFGASQCVSGKVTSVVLSKYRHT